MPSYNIIFKGDSITAGVPYTPYPSVYGYPAKFGRLAGSDWTVTNLGVQGQTVQTMLANVSTEIIPLYNNSATTNFFCLLAGINDAATGRTASQIQSDIKGWHDAIHAAKPAAKTICCTLTDIAYPNSAVATAKPIRDAVNVWLRANWQTFADIFVDLGAVSGLDDATNGTYFQTSDGVHLTYLGYQLVAQTIAKALLRVNYAKARPVTVSDTFNSSYPASYITDGVHVGPNFWLSQNQASTSYHQICVVDLGGLKTLNEIDFYFVKDDFASATEPTLITTGTSYNAADFKCEYSADNGATWQTVIGGTITGNNKVWKQFLLTTPIQATHVRMNATAITGSYLGMYEIEAWGYSADLTNPTGSITSPASGATSSGTQDFLVAAADNTSVESLQLLVGGKLTGTPQTTPLNKISYNTKLLRNYYHTFAVVITDTSGNITITNTVNLLVYNADVPTNYALAENGSTATATSQLSSNYSVNELINNTRAGIFGSGNAWVSAVAPSDGSPQVVTIDFHATRRINNFNIFSVRDNIGDDSPPTLTEIFTLYGAIDFTVEYLNTSNVWTALPGGVGVVTNNNKVWKQILLGSFIFAKQMRVTITRSASTSYVGLFEVEAVGMVDAQAPTGTITSPAFNGATYTTGTFNLQTADAADDTGIANVQWRLNGAAFGSPVTVAPYTLAVNVTGLTNGVYYATAVITDTNGNSFETAPRTIIIARPVSFKWTDTLTFKSGAVTLSVIPNTIGTQLDKDSVLVARRASDGTYTLYTSPKITYVPATSGAQDFLIADRIGNNIFNYAHDRILQSGVLLGRASAGGGEMEDIRLGNGLAFSNGKLVLS